MELSSGRMAFNNISFLISDAALASEDLLIGLPVLEHLGIDFRTLLERNRAQIDGTDFSTVPLHTENNMCGSIGRLMIANLEWIDDRHVEVDDPDYLAPDDKSTSTSTDLDPGRPRRNYFSNRFDDDPFPNPNMMELDGPAKNK